MRSQVPAPACKPVIGRSGILREIFSFSRILLPVNSASLQIACSLAYLVAAPLLFGREYVRVQYCTQAESLIDDVGSERLASFVLDIQ